MSSEKIQLFDFGEFRIVQNCMLQFWEASQDCLVRFWLASYVTQHICNAYLWCFYSITFHINPACSNECPGSLFLDFSEVAWAVSKHMPKTCCIHKHKSNHAIITNRKSTLKDWHPVLGYLSPSNSLQVRIMLSEHTRFTIVLEFFTIKHISMLFLIDMEKAV